MRRCISLTHKYASPPPTSLRTLSTLPSASKVDTEGSDWVNSDEYQFFERSPVPSDKFQQSMFRLPIPKLDETLKRYLDSQRPLLDDDRMARTEKLAEKFAREEGAALDGELRALDSANSHTSYINKPWTDMYLRDRRPVLFTHNPGIMLANDTRAAMADSDARIASILVSSLRFFRSLRSGVLKPEVFHLKPAKTDNEAFWNRYARLMPRRIATPIAAGLMSVYPLDMSQHKHLFQTTRIPLPQMDEIRRFPDARHIVIMRRGHFYAFDVLDEDFNIFHPSYYLSAVRSVLRDSPSSAAPGLGVLTSDDRDSWSDARKHLETISAKNAEFLEKVDSALFVICVDDDWNFKEVDLLSIDTVENIVYGHDPVNRWSDKSFSLIASNNGGVGINFEHAWGDGVALLTYINSIIDDSQNNDFGMHGQSADFDYSSVQRLEFQVDDCIKNAIASAKSKFEEKRNSVNFDGYILHGFGRADCKRHNNLSPDSLMQTAFQVAYHRVKGDLAPVYESCSTSAFRHGRTETLRALTTPSKRFVEAFNSASNSGTIPDNRSELIELLKLASDKHKELTSMAVQGKGWDRHLFALKTLCQESGKQLPDLLADESYAAINRSVISTSTLNSHKMIHGGFCPVVPEGFGFAYQIRDDMLGSYVSSFQCASEMKRAYVETMLDLKKLLK